MKVNALLILAFALEVSAFQWPWENDSSSSSSLSASSTTTGGFKWPWEQDSSSTSSSSSSIPSSSSLLSTSDSGLNFHWPWEDKSTTTSLQSATTSGSPDSVTSELDDGQAYAPKATECPDGDVVREAKELHEKEKEYIQKRQEITNEKLAKFLKDVAQLSDFDSQSFIDDNKDTHNITIGLAYSGGGFRAMLNGAGQMLALDDRYDELSLKGLGGLLQSVSYLSGLSGGSWLVGSLVLNDWITVSEAILGKSGIWELDNLIFSNPVGNNITDLVKYFYSVGESVDTKEDSGFETSITDVWGRALSWLFFNDESTYQRGENVTWSSIRELSNFVNHSMPYPIVVAGSRNPGTIIVNENSTVFEITPYELGSWDPSLRSFVDLNYMGTSLDGGKPNASQCVTNFDNAGFILGTLSSLFNQVFVKLETNSEINFAIKRVLNLALSKYSDEDEDIATYEPNPFYNVEYGDDKNLKGDGALHLVDGGEDSQNIPLYPLIQTKRGMDVIFAYDNSADLDSNLPNGTSLVYTFQRQFSEQGRGTPFPYVPPVSEFLHEGLTDGPVFFGCDASNLTDLVKYHNSDLNETDVPLIVYMPNQVYLYEGNQSTYKMSYDEEEIHGIIENGFAVSSRGNYSDDSQWPTCVGCAIIRRQQERLGQEQSDECKKCFQNYCWTGGIEDTPQESFGPYNTDGLTALMSSYSSSQASRSKSSSVSGSKSLSGSTSRSLSESDSTSRLSAETSPTSTSESTNGSNTNTVAAESTQFSPTSLFTSSTGAIESRSLSATTTYSASGLGTKTTWSGLLLLLSVISLF